MSIQLVDGRTALLIPFRLPENQSRTKWAGGLLARMLPVSEAGAETTPMWSINEERPVEVLDLFPQFQDSLLSAHWSGEADAIDPEKGSISLKLDASLIERYKAAEIVTNNNEYEVTLAGIDIVVYPHRVGVLVVRIDYGNHGDPRMAIRTLIAARHLHSEGGICGWVFKPQHGVLPQGRVPEADGSEWLDTMSNFAGEICNSLHDGVPAGKPLEPVRLGTLANWLLLPAGERPQGLDPVLHGAAIRAGRELPAHARIELTRFARHQSAFVLEGELSPEVQTRLLYHLGRAYKDDYLVPDETDALDVVLRPRRNRIIGISREGAASISWLEAGSNEVLEVYQWPSTFLNFYLAMHVHVLAERIALSNCAYDLSRGAEQLSMLRVSQAGSQEAADKMQSLVARVSGTFLRATGSDTGGSSEYQHFYGGMRQVHDSERVMAEVRQRLSDLDALGGGWTRAGETLLAHERFIDAFELDREERRLDREERQQERSERDVERDVLEREPAERESNMGRTVAMAGFFLIVFSLLHVMQLMFPAYMRNVTNEPLLGMSTLFIIGYLAWRITRRLLPNLGRSKSGEKAVEASKAS